MSPSQTVQNAVQDCIPPLEHIQQLLARLSDIDTLPINRVEQRHLGLCVTNVSAQLRAIAQGIQIEVDRWGL